MNPDDARVKQVDALFADYVAAGGPGYAVGVWHKGEPVCLRGYGLADLEQNTPITPQTPFHVASVSKQFAAFSLALLARDGKLDLEADIRSYLPFMPDFGVTITPGHLIHHTSGVRDQWMLFILGGQDMTSRLRQQMIVNMMARQRALNFPPGSEYCYSNMGYTLVAETVKAVTGQTLRQFTTERMFKPLGMTRTHFFDDVTEIVAGRTNSYDKGDGGWRRALLNYDNVGATSLFTTAEDMTKWAANFANPVVGDRALIEQVTTGDHLTDGTPTHYGFALYKQSYAGRSAFGHAGADAGYRAMFTFFPAEAFSVTVLANHPPENFDRLISGIVDIYLNDAAPKKDYQPAEATPTAAEIDALTGFYLHPYDPVIELAPHKDGLGARSGEGPAQPVVLRVDGTFDSGSGARAWTHYRPVRDGEGTVTAIEDCGTTQYRKDRILKKIVPVSPTQAEFAEIAGDYRCPELDITYTLSEENGRLLARSLWSAGPIVLRPTLRDRFDSDMLVFVLVRDGRGKVTGLKAHGMRIRNVAMERV